MKQLMTHVHIHLVDLDVRAVVLYLNLGQRFPWFFLDFDRFDALLQNGSSGCNWNDAAVYSPGSINTQ